MTRQLAAPACASQPQAANWCSQRNNLVAQLGDKKLDRIFKKNEKRAGYGDQMIEELGRRLTADYGQGFSLRNLWDMKRFFADFHILQALPAESTQASQSG
jgi:hypothetical protein